MTYGTKTLNLLARLESQCSITEAANYEIKQFMPDFSLRLAEFLEDYCNFYMADITVSQTVDAILKRAKDRDISLAKTTFLRWLGHNDVDPSINAEKDDTRLNIYKLSAVLDLDYSKICILFEKVFFTRPFNPKSMQEIAFLYYVSRKDKEWYKKGTELISSIDISPVEKCEKKTDSNCIVNDVLSVEGDDALKAYLLKNRDSFSRDNQNSAAREKIAQYAECAKKLSMIDSNDALIEEITGYNPRPAEDEYMGSIKSLPRHLTMKFPSGVILSNILSGKETSFAATYKMLVLLIFYLYFRKNVISNSSKKGQCENEITFRGFLNIANEELDAVGYGSLYPKQPFSGLILYCAAQESPLDAFKTFLEDKITEVSCKNISEKFKGKFSGVPENIIDSIVRICRGKPFLTELICRNANGYSLPGIIKLFDDDYLNDDEYMEYEATLAILELCRCGNLSSHDGKILACYADIISCSGIDSELFNSLVADACTTEKLIDRGWLEIGRDKRVYMDSHVKNAIKNCFIGKHLVDEHLFAD